MSSTAVTTSPVKEEVVHKTPRKLKQGKTPSSPCVLPVLDGKPNTLDTAIEIYDQTQDDGGLERDPTFLTSANNDFIPLDILNSLTHVPTPPTREQLGPSSKHKKLKPIENGVAPPARRRPANVWNYPKGREKLKHLAEQPPCLCGAGRDISFLYDVVNHTCKDKTDSADAKTLAITKLPASVEQQIRDLGIKDDKQEISLIPDEESSKQEDPSQIPDTLVPGEYHIVKNPGVMGLEFHDDKYTTHIEDHEEHLTIFPSMKPAGRGEVLKLKHTMDSLLNRAGVDDNDKELTGPTQIHNLLELVKKEQNIYNVCFNEIIRQVTVECAERGELLANIRKRYSQLLDRIPRQVKSLHQEVIAQRALDRRLTEELVRFKASISALTNELASVKAHDREVTKQAVEAQKELEEALLESDKNASLLAEYHDLYELQRKRLETQVGKLTEERDLWGSAAYTLSMKVTDKHSLNTAKKLHLCEKAWAKLARHFAIFLSEKDSIQLESLTEHVQLWRENADQFNKQLEDSEDKTRKKLKKLVDQWTRWKKEFEKIINYDNGSVTVPTRQFITKLHDDLKFWEETFNEEAERFTGEVLLAREDELFKMNKQVDKWTDVAMKVFGRHQTPAGERWPQHGEMKTLNQEVDILHQQFHVRTIGENGVAKGIIDLVNPIETWSNKLDAILHGGDMMQDSEWIRLADLIGNEWIDHLSATILLIASTLKEGQRLAGELEKRVEVQEVVLKMAKWLTATNNSIDNEDGKIVQKVSLIHSTMTRWMITVLLRLAPDMEDKELEKLSSNDDKTNLDSSIGGGEILLQSTTEEIITRGSQLFEELRVFSMQLSKCCTDLVFDSMQQRKDQGDEHADMEYKDLKRINTEFEGWTHTAKLLIQEVTGEDYIPEEKPKEIKATETKKDEEGGARSTTPGGGQVVEKPEEGSTPVVPPDIERAKSVSDKSTVPIPKGTPRSTPKGTPRASPEPSKVATTPEPPAEEPQPASEEKEKTEKVVEGGSGQDKEEGDASTMHVLCHDDNIRTKSLVNLPVEQDAALLDVPGSEGLPARSPSPDTTKALEALAAVERLQIQLLETEERAQGSEERAIQAETELKQALERIRALERSVSRASATSTRTPGQLTPGSDTPVSSTTLKRPVSQTPSSQTRAPSQQSTRASTRASSRKK